MVSLYLILTSNISSFDLLTCFWKREKPFSLVYLSPSRRFERMMMIFSMKQAKNYERTIKREREDFLNSLNNNCVLLKTDNHMNKILSMEKYFVYFIPKDQGILQNLIFITFDNIQYAYSFFICFGGL